MRVLSIIDKGPDELDHTEFIDSDLLEVHCKACRHRMIERQQARKHKPQTFRRL